MYSKNDVLLFIEQEIKKPSTIEEIKKGLFNSEKEQFIYLKNISLSQLNRILKKLERLKKINYLFSRADHPKRFPTKKYFINPFTN